MFVPASPATKDGTGRAVHLTSVPAAPTTQDGTGRAVHLTVSSLLDAAMRRSPLLIVPALVLVLLAAAPAGAETVRCQRAIAKGSARYAQDRVKALARCESLKIKGTLPASTACHSEAGASARIARAAARLAKDVATACGGTDETCGVDFDGSEESPGTIGFPATCHDLGASGCDGAITHCGDVAGCLACVADHATDLAVAQATGALVPGTASDETLNKCQQAVAKQTSLLVQQRSRILHKCWDLRLRDKHAAACPDASAAPGSPGRTAFDDLATVEAKAVRGVCRLCGGPDRECNGTGDLAPTAIGFATSCADVTVPSSGASCAAGGTIDTLADVAACVTCATSHITDCTDRGAVPQYSTYPTACNTAALATCSRLEVTIATSFTPPVSPSFVAGISTSLDYPGARLEIPGSGSAASVVARVTNLTGVAGSLLSAADLDVVPDALDDRISVGMLNTGSALPSGAFVKITFDCRPGEPVPQIGSFTCTPSASTLEGELLPSSCQVAALTTYP